MKQLTLLLDPSVLPLVVTIRSLPPQPTTKEFKVASVSSNLNAFGHNGVILVARDGETWEVAHYFYPDSTDYRKGTVYTARLQQGVPVFRNTEIPRRLTSAPTEVVEAIWA